MEATEGKPTRLRKLRHDRGLTLDVAAGEIGVGISTLQRCEMGTMMPTVGVALAVAKWAKLKVEDLWTLTEIGVEPVRCHNHRRR